MGNLSILRGALASAQVSAYTTGAITLPSARGVFVPPTYFESIATVTLSTSTASISFTSIPQTYTHLQIRGFQKAAGAGDLNFIINGDTGSNYARSYLYTSGGGTADSGGGGSQTSGYVGYNPSSTHFQSSVISFLDYTSTVKTKTTRSYLGADANGSGYVMQTSNLWYATPAAITTITFTHGGGNFSQYSQLALYGIKGA